MWLPFNATCQWNITAPEGRVVRISVYARSFHESCSASHVRVHDGPSGSSNLILDYCISSSIFRGYFFSSGRSLFLEAKTGISNYTAYLRVYYNAETFQGEGKVFYNMRPIRLNSDRHDLRSVSVLMFASVYMKPV